MKRTRTLLFTALVLSAVTAGFALTDFLGLHDINKDYVSRSALDHLGISVEERLPEWTNTRDEWRIIRVGYGVRVLSLTVTIAALALCLSESRTG